MTLIPLVPGKTEVQLTARGRANKVPPALLEAPGGLYPLKSAAFEVDEYRIMSGWPVPIPDCDIQIQCLVSAEGDVIGNRDSPTALTTNAAMRWVADDSYYDELTGQWSPIQGGVGPWLTSPDSAPTLYNDYEYTIGNERFVNMTVLNFDSDTADYMWNDLSLFMGGTSGYTVLMVMSPNSIYGNNTDVVENALWSPDDTTVADPSKNWASFGVRSQAAWLTTESTPAQVGVPLGNGLANNAPTYLVLVVSRPQTTLYAASGPSNVQIKALASGSTPVPLSTRFWLGKSPFPNTSTVDMALLDLSIYGDPLSRTDVVNEITALSTVYGGDS